MAKAIPNRTPRRASIKGISNLTSGRRLSIKYEDAEESPRRRHEFLKRGGGGYTSDGTIITQTRRGSKSFSTSLIRGMDGGEKKRGWKQVQDNRSKFKDDALFKFRAVARLVIAFNRLIKSHSLRYRDNDDISPYINGLRFYDYESIGDEIELLFDPRKFKADKQLRISEDTKKILSKAPSSRTAEEVHNATVALRNIQSISQYPIRMQRKIAEVGMYEKYEAKRIIVRQGHRASYFYFILSGSVVVMLMEGDTKYARPVAKLIKGQAFGELAIINRTTRQSTVIAKETLEMLSISIEDFHNIFMSGGVKNINDPDHNEFIRSIDFLSGWPVEILTKDPKKCIFHYFKRGDILMKDSNFSQWIYVVKSGSLKVLKKLKRVGPYGWRQRENEALTSYGTKKQKTEKERLKEQQVLLKQRKFVLPELNVPLRDPDTIPMTSPIELEHLHLVNINRSQSENTFAPSEIDQITQRSRSSLGLSSSNELMPLKNGLSTKGYLSYRSSTFSDVTPQKSLQTQSTSNNPNRNSNNSQHQNTKKDDNRKFGGKLEKEQSTTDEEKSHKKSSKRKTKPTKEDAVEEMKEEVKGFKQEVRTIVDDFDAKYKEKDPDDITEADLDPQFVHIQTLTKGQVFGLREAFLGKQVSLCLVSNGAECIMIDRNFYMEHAPDTLVRNMRIQCCPYPNEEELQENLQVQVDWGAYKDATMKETLIFLRSKLK